MNATRTLLALITGATLGFAVRGQTQAPAQPKSNLQLLQELKASNQTQLDKQTALMKELEALKEAATQLKIFAKRG